MSSYEQEFAHEGEFHEGEFGEGEGEFAHEGEFHEGEGEFAHEGEFHEGEFGEGEGEFHEGEFHEGEGEFGEGEGEFSHEMHAESPLTEVQEVQLASELLEIGSEQELDHFIGGLIKGVGGFMKSSAGRALGGVLKNVAKQALPVVGGALGSFIAPGVGTAIGSKLGSMAGNLFEVPVHEMNPEQAEFEVARRYVRLATAAARNASLAPPTLPPQVIANRALAAAARQYAPGLVRPRRRRRGGRVYGSYPVYGGYPAVYADDDGGNGDDPRPRSGRWVRRGRKVVLYGL
jgi:hypothetical protein